MRLRSALTLCTLSACSWIPTEDYAARFDLDGDGVDGLIDCDDRDADIAETQRFYTDADGDGFGDPSLPVDACRRTPPAGAAAVDGDCDDDDAHVHPDAVEVCNGRDDDCDDRVDDDDNDLDGSTGDTWLPDADDDGFVSDAGLALAVFACEAPAGFAAPGSELDCNDADPAVNPAASEVCGDEVDNDCDGAADDAGIGGGAYYADADQDGWPDDWVLIEACDDPAGGLVREPDAPTGTTEPDCDPTDPGVHPGQTEVWYDGVDADCDGADDYDRDGDGARDPQGQGADCDDDDATVHPGATDDWYDGVDSDCAGNDDFDQDGDGVAALSGGGTDCVDTDPAIRPGALDSWYDGVDSDCAGNDDFDQDGDGERHVTGGGADCDDTDPARHPGADDPWYDGIDADCAGNDDFDQDGDGAAAPSGGGYDCDDTDPARFPDAVEVYYDGVDADCAGDDDYDQDGDGVRHPSGGGDDCDDLEDTVFPGADDAWYDGVDTDCDGADDFDQDGDGARHASGGGQDCDDTDNTSYPGAIDLWYDGDDTDCAGNDDYDQDGDGYRHPLGGGSDCDDTDDGVHPDAVEVFYDGIDADCAGDDDFDQDGDGRTPATAPFGTRDDCDDLDDAVFAGAAEVPDDGVDQDCNSVDAISCYTDADLDGIGRVLVLGLDGTCGSGLVPVSGDCDDSDAATYPGAPELCDQIDQDCDGLAQGQVASATLRSGERLPLASGATIDGAETERVDLCGADWDLSIQWSPADGDLTVAGHPAFATPSLSGGRSLVVATGAGRSSLSLEELDLAYDAPLLTPIDVTGDPLERPTVVLDGVRIANNRLDRVAHLTEVDLVWVDVTVQDSDFLEGAFAQTGGTLQVYDSRFERVTRVPRPGGADGAVVEVTDVFAELADVEVHQVTGRAMGFWNSSVVLSDTTWEDNWYDPRDAQGDWVDADGGALYLERSELMDERSTFRRNSTLGRGGAVAAVDSTLLFTDAVFEDNGPTPAGTGGAVAVERGGALAIDGSLELVASSVTDSTAALQGGSIHHTGNELTLSDGTQVLRSTLLPGNLGGVALYSDGSRVSTAYDGLITGFQGEETNCVEVHTDSWTYLQGMDFTDCDTRCLEVEGASSLTLSSNHFEGCNAPDDGGAVRVTNVGYVDLYSSTYDSNHSGGDGGAIYLDAAYLDINYDPEFRNNTADGSGGAIYAPYATTEVCEATFDGNEAVADAGALYVGGSRVEFGEGTFCSGEASFTGNHAGGRGGAVFVFEGEMELHDVHITGNTADQGGGAYVEGYVDMVSNVTLEGNRATRTGGGIHLDLPFATASDFGTLTFRGNQADVGGGLYVEGIGWNQDFPQTVFAGTTFVQNTAAEGSAAYIEPMFGFFEIPGFFSITLSDTFDGDVVLDRNQGATTFVRAGADGDWVLDIEALSAQTFDDQGTPCALPIGTSLVTCAPGEACICP